MIWIILFPLLVLFSRWKNLYARAYDFGDYVAETVFLLILMFLAMVGGVLLAWVSSHLFRKEWHEVEEEEKELVNLRNGATSSGGFFLGSGFVGSEEYYFYYYKVGDGYKRGKLHNDGCVMVYEEDRQDGVLITCRSDFARGWFWAFAACVDSDQYDIRIPKGSLKMGFNID